MSTNLSNMSMDQIRTALGFKTVGQMKPIFGKMTEPIRATRVISRPLDHFVDRGIQAHAVIAINDNDGTFTAVNLYEKKVEGSTRTWWVAGENFDPKWSTNPITDKAKGKWDEKGYQEVDANTFWPVVVPVESTVHAESE